MKNSHILLGMAITLSFQGIGYGFQQVSTHIIGSGTADPAVAANGYDELNSPCRDCRDKGGKHCCKDSTCDMYLHSPYQPENHGYYYFRPYNYTAVWKHQQWIAQIGGDARSPYSRAIFVPVYEQFENTAYDPDHKPSTTLETLPHVSKSLPDLEQLLQTPPPDAVPLPPAPGEPAPMEPAPARSAVDAPAPRPEN